MIAPIAWTLVMFCPTGLPSPKDVEAFVEPCASYLDCIGKSFRPKVLEGCAVGIRWAP